MMNAWGRSTILVIEKTDTMTGEQGNMGRKEKKSEGCGKLYAEAGAAVVRATEQSKSGERTTSISGQCQEV